MTHRFRADQPRGTSDHRNANMTLQREWQSCGLRQTGADATIARIPPLAGQNATAVDRRPLRGLPFSATIRSACGNPRSAWKMRLPRATIDPQQQFQVGGAGILAFKFSP